MLKALTVQDFALVTALDINFGDGLTVITGESGAGKSILLGALGLVLGERASASVVRPGAGRADVSAEFDLSGFPQALGYLRDQALLDDDDGASSLCLVRRVVTSDGRSRAFINGTPVTLGVLRELCEGLVDIHGQDENQRLGQRAVQLALLDDFGTEPALRRACRDAYRAWQQASQAARDLAEDIERRSDKAALLAYQLEELERLALQPGEFEQIEAEHKRLAQAQTLRERVAEALAALEDDAVTGRVLRLLGSIDDTHPELESAMAALSAASDLQSDAERDLRGYADSLDVDPGHLEDLDARLAAIHELARKHRIAPAALYEHASALQQEQQALSTDRSSLEALLASAKAQHDAFLGHARKLSKQRRAAARDFAGAVSQCINTLGIRGGSLALEFSDAESEAGLESVEFHVTTNPKYPAGPLNRIASGGERARISLAIQVVAAAKSALPCLVLDEADVGVGGTTADVVGRLLRALAEHTQVICVTHAPQVAALAQHHLRVHKSADQDTQIEPIDDSGRVEELARMLAGADITEKSRDYARTLMAEARSGPGTVH